jgi:hypothetical protein
VFQEVLVSSKERWEKLLDPTGPGSGFILRQSAETPPKAQEDYCPVDSFPTASFVSRALGAIEICLVTGLVTENGNGLLSLLFDSELLFTPS